MCRASRVEVGYILGVASSRSHEAIPERNMSPLACAVMRFILHACFMWSASQQPEVKHTCAKSNQLAFAMK